jgi:hypothetical protein
MPKIILPFDSEERSIPVAGWGLVTLKAYQIATASPAMKPPATPT